MKHPTSSIISALALSTLGNSVCNAFTSVASNQRPSTATWMSEPSNTPATLVSQAAFVYGIDVLKADMGLEIIPEDQKPMYAIGKLEAELPLELVSGIRFSDCESVTLISQVRQDVVDATGLSSLDTIVAVRAGNDGEGNYAYYSDVRESSIQNTAQTYTEAINFAMTNSLPSIELEINRLVPMMPSQEDL
eukprot:CAMPEP_0113431762 /NCGR_PEP_ID=MMETSP0013_2-20120614/33761_1 /TAXON_ID=2843 ORGANISM="Skeletonema costatum, Strain 1716" /NCGR_SAMPLE_ID=MMETSP0013_2 /ASSEMBLY_ACC=CAM_ASM_000158 /LENGTH=190 /DNA_ID=CAMNT_0000320783 /DNA_START=57 /DNA_END=629 /DNA_ORIENTATION=- /assembly_acc=CAM_ASM_000158